MACCGCKLILLQTIAIAAIGVGAGLADSLRRPIKLGGREAPPDPFAAPAGQPGSQPPAARPTPAPAASPTSTSPGQGAGASAVDHGSQTSNVQLNPAGANTNSGLKPGDPGWKPTEKAALPKGQITLDEAKRLFDSGASFVDARRKEDYEQGHIKGAIRLNLKSFEHGDPPLLAMIPREGFVVVYCSGGNCDESEHVAEFLSNSGYAKVYVIHDGYPGWKTMGYPDEKGEGIQ